MNAAAWMALTPLIVLSLGIIALMTQIAIRRMQAASLAICVLSLVATAAALGWSWPAQGIEAGPLMIADRLGYLFALSFTLCGLVVSLLASGYLRRMAGETDEFLLLLLISILGAMVLCYARHLASLILGIEMLGITLYALIAYPEKSWLPLEAGIKYLVLSGAASSILLFGFALLYAETGALDFAGIGLALARQNSSAVILVSSAMILTGLGFKLSLVPYHMWTPDVYEGSPGPVTAYLATVSKGAVFVALLRWYLDAGLHRYQGLLECLSALAILSMLVGNLLALHQSNLKRLLAYSSIAHMGYLLVALVVCGFLPDAALATEAAGYYLIAYIVTTLAAFAAVSLLPLAPKGAESGDIVQFEGLFWREPLLALLLAVALLSLAGIPLTTGFIGKFYLVAAGVSAGLWPLLAALVIGSAIGIYYYLRVVYAMSLEPREGALLAASYQGLRLRGLTIMLIVAVLALGIYPQPLIGYLGNAWP